MFSNSKQVQEKKQEQEQGQERREKYKQTKKEKYIDTFYDADFIKNYFS
jgi:hypothetical protein